MNKRVERGGADLEAFQERAQGFIDARPVDWLAQTEGKAAERNSSGHRPHRWGSHLDPWEIGLAAREYIRHALAP